MEKHKLDPVNMNSLIENNWNQKLPFADKSNIKVTSNGSLYGDEVWKYSSEIAQRNIKGSATSIKWNIDLGNGKNLSDIEFHLLLESSKDFIFSYRFEQNRNGRGSKATTIIKHHKSLIPLLRWMAENEITDFSYLTSEHVISYVNYQRNTISKFGKPLSEGELFKRFDVINQLWNRSDFISSPILQNPFPSDNPNKLSGNSINKKIERKFDAIPDNIALKLVSKSIEYIEKSSENILAAYDDINLTYKLTVENFSTAEADRRSRSVAKKYGYAFVKDNTKDVGLLRTSCYIIIALFSGIRDSEISSLDFNCISEDTEGGYLWIKGFIYKTSNSKVSSKWMIPPIVITAVNVAKRISSPLRSQLIENINQTEIMLAGPLTTGKKLIELQNSLRDMISIKDSLWLVKSSKNGNAISSNKTIHQQLKDYITVHKSEFDHNQVWNLHPHQFRKTFVKFMVKNAMNLKYLQEHFKHISLDMTAWYDIDDAELSKEIVDYYSSLTHEKITKIVNENNIAGKGGEHILKMRSPGFCGVTSESKDMIIKALADTVTLRSTGVSWCMGDNESGNCSGVHGCLIAPSQVNSCSQAIVTKDFVPIWLDMKMQNEELLDRNDLGSHQKDEIRSFLNKVIYPIVNSLSEGI